MIRNEIYWLENIFITMIIKPTRKVSTKMSNLASNQHNQNTLNIMAFLTIVMEKYVYYNELCQNKCQDTMLPKFQIAFMDKKGDNQGTH